MQLEVKPMLETLKYAGPLILGLLGGGAGMNQYDSKDLEAAAAERTEMRTSCERQKLILREDKEISDLLMRRSCQEKIELIKELTG